MGIPLMGMQAAKLTWPCQHVPTTSDARPLGFVQARQQKTQMELFWSPSRRRDQDLVEDAMYLFHSSCQEAKEEGKEAAEAAPKAKGKSKA